MNFENPYGIPSLISTICFIVLAVYVLRNNPKRRANQVTALLFLSLIIWGLAETIERFAGPPPGVLMSSWEALGSPYPATQVEGHDLAFFSSKLIGVGVLLLAPTFLHFSLVVPRRRSENKFLLGAVYGVYFVFLAILWGTNNFVTEPKPYFAGWGSYYGDWEFLYYSYPLACVVFGFTTLANSYFKADSIIEKNQAKFVFLGVLSAIILVIPTAIIPEIIGWETYPLTSVAMIVLAAFMTYSIVKYKLFVIEAVTEKAQAEVEEAPRLDPGFSYLVKEKGTHYSYEIFRGMVTTTPGLCLTSFYPQKFRSEYSLEKTPIIWLTDVESEEKTYRPERMEFEISYALINFMKENERTVLLLDDLKYLAMVNGVEKTLEFLKSLVDVASVNDSSIIVPLDSETFDEGELNYIEGIFDSTLSYEGGDNIEGDLKMKPGYSYLVKETKPEKAFGMVKSITDERQILCLSKTFPGKLKKLYGLEKGSYFWLTASTTEENSLDPGRLEFEIAQTVLDFMKKNPGSTVLIDGIEQLAFSTSFDHLTGFLKDVTDVASINKVSVVVPFSPKSFEGHEAAILEKRFDVVLEGEEE